MERRTFDETVELRGTGEGETEKIVGTAIVFYDGTERTEFTLWDDRGKYEGGQRMVERIDAKAVTQNTLRDDVRGLFNHDPSLLLGRSNKTTKTLRMNKDADGLHYEIEPGDTQVGRDTMEHIRRGDVSGSSFAFSIAAKGQKFEEDGDTAIRTITKLERLYDVGPVTYPAYQSTEAGVRASSDMQEARDAFKSHREAIEAERATAAEELAVTHKGYADRIDALETE